MNLKKALLIGLGIFIGGLILLTIGVTKDNMVIGLLGLVILLFSLSPIVVVIYRYLQKRFRFGGLTKVVEKEVVPNKSFLFKNFKEIKEMFKKKEEIESKTTKQCPYCKSEIPLGAKKCPQCQSNLRSWFNRHPVLTFIMFLFVIGIIFSIIGSGAKREGYIPPEKAEKAPAIYSINQNVRVGDIRWKILEAKDLGFRLKGSQSRYPTFQEDITTTGKFIKVRFEVENLGQELKSVTWLRLVDSRNREYVPHHGVSAWISKKEDLLLIENLNPNVPKTLTVIFDVAKDSSGLKFKATDLRILGAGVKEAFIELGL